MENKKPLVKKGTTYKKLRTKVNKLEDVILRLSHYKNLDPFEKFHKNIIDIIINYDKLEYLLISGKLETKLKQHMAKRFIEVDSIKIFTKFLNKMTSKLLEYKDDQEYYPKEINCVLDIFSILIINANADLNFGEKICEEDDLLKFFNKILTEFGDKTIDTGSRTQFYKNCVGKILRILYYTLIHDSTHNIMKMREYEFLKVIKEFVEDDTYTHNMFALLFKSYVVDKTIVDETKDGVIDGYQKRVRRIIHLLKITLNDGEISEPAYRTELLAKNILQLSKNDHIKYLLVEWGIWDLIPQLLDKNSFEIQITTLLILWSLFFHEDNKKRILEEFLEKIEYIRNNLDKSAYRETETDEFLLHFNDIICINRESGNEIEELRQTLDNVLWVLKSKENPISNKAFTKTSEDMIMISYSPKDEETVKKIYYELRKRGYKLWINFENKKVKIMESMARAVEQSKAVIICGSYSYQTSESCRQEMTHAKNHKKCLVLLKVESDFTPCAWLKEGLKDQMRFDMSGKNDFETSVSKLIDHLDRQVFNTFNKDIGEYDNIIPVSAVLTQDKPSHNVSELTSWTNSDVIKWLHEIGITIINPETKCEGADLAYLRNLDTKRFSDYCQGSLGISNLRDTRIFYNELQKLNY